MDTIADRVTKPSPITDDDWLPQEFKVRHRPTKKPSPITGGWLPQDPRARVDFIRELIEKSREDRAKHRGPDKKIHPELWAPVVQDLLDLIEDSAQLSMFFRSMFEEIPFSHRHDPVGDTYEFVDYIELLDFFNYLLDKPPQYDTNMMVALPFTVVLEWPMATRGGLAAFLDKDVNLKMGAILNKWGEYLADPSKDSNKYIVNNPDNETSWLSKDARKIMQKRDPGKRIFENLYECDSNETVHLGFKTWDQFFTRKFKNYGKSNTVRPVQDTSDKTITSGCEAAPYAIKQKVKKQEKFWIKGQPYSLKHMLASETEAAKFEGGTVYQAFLSPLTYHRWHAPINGTIKKLQIIDGSYFSISPINSFPDPETFANTQSQPYLSAVATRALIYIENSTVGEMVMMPIGMVEVSTCTFAKDILDGMQVDPDNKKTWIPLDDQPLVVKKGRELGMFHFGGSTHCLIFNKNVQLKFWQQAVPLDTEENYFVPLNAVIADCKKIESSVVSAFYPGN